MTREELKTRCLALAGCGDSAAIATLKLFEDYERIKSSLPGAGEFVGVMVNGQVVDGVEPRPRAQVPPPRRSADAHLREDKPEEGASVDEAKSVNALAREYGIPQDGPEAAAIAATRAAHGLPATTDPLAAAANPLMKTGGFEKVPGANKDGNKE